MFLKFAVCVTAWNLSFRLELELSWGVSRRAELVDS